MILNDVKLRTERLIAANEVIQDRDAGFADMQAIIEGRHRLESASLRWMTMAVLLQSRPNPMITRRCWVTFAYSKMCLNSYMFKC